MVDNQIVQMNLNLPELGSIEEEIAHIKQEFIYSNIAKEIAMFRIWRLHKTQLWRKIIDTTGKQVYQTWEDFIGEMIQSMAMSRPIIFQRLKVYYILEFLQYSSNEAVAKLVSKPSMITHALFKFVDWDIRNNQPTSIIVPGKHSLTKDEAIVEIRNIVDKIDSFDSARDANKYLDENIFGEPVYRLYRDGMNLVLEYTFYAVDQQGNFIIDDEGEITFRPDMSYNTLIQSVLDKKFR